MFPLLSHKIHRMNQILDTGSDAGTYRSHLHHLQLDVLGLREAPSSLRHWDVLDPLVVSLGRAVVCGQGLGELRHGLGQQVCGLWTC